MWYPVFLSLMLSVASVFVAGEIIAYDCKDRDTELTRLSLLKVKPCLDPRNASETATRKIQLIQERRYSEVHVLTCMITVQQLITHCGMHSHTSIVAGGLGKFIHYVKTNACRDAHRFRRLDLAGLGAGVFSNLALNGTTEVSTTLAGNLDTHGKCNGVKFSVNEVTYEDVVVSAAITVRLFDYSAVANVEENRVTLRTGTVCPYSAGYCFDDLAGEVTWESQAKEVCTSTGIDVLYEGPATVLTLKPDGSTNKQHYIVVEAYDTVFALKLISREIICNQQAWRTEQNRLLIIFDTSLGFYYRKTQKLVQNTDMMAQVLSKLLFLEIAVKRHMSEVIYDSILKRCRLREKILQNRLALALESPDVVSGLVRDAPGHVGRVVGEVLYIARCSAKVVDYRRSEFCYQELPITYNNESRFMTPITHIIKDHGTQVDCSDKLPAMYHLENKWLELLPEVHHARPDPIELDANEEEHVLHMTKISPISSHGVYTKEEMEQFQKALLFPTEKEAITSLVTRRVIGRTTDHQGYHMTKVFSATEFKEMAITSAEQVWGFLSRMGNYFSVFALLYTLFSVISYVGGVILNYFALKKATRVHQRPRSFLWASLWHALANRYLHHLHHHQRNAEDPGVQLESVCVNSDANIYPHLTSVRACASDSVIVDISNPPPPMPVNTRESN